MNGFVKILKIESKLFLRDTAVMISAIALPAMILLILGAIPALRAPDDIFDGHSFVDVFAPSLLVMTLTMLGLNALPNALATYRERGILRRLSTTPAAPAALLAAQLVINVAVAVAGAVLLLAIGRLAFDIPLPTHPLGFAVAFILGAASLFALGLLVAALARSARAASGVSAGLGALVMFLGGVYLPRFLLPDFLVRIGNVTPPGIQALQDAWTGTSPKVLPLAIMAAVAIVAGGMAARFFRWE
jgi:ABC-2 type transport system permease protein